MGLKLLDLCREALLRIDGPLSPGRNVCFELAYSIVVCHRKLLYFVLELDNTILGGSRLPFDVERPPILLLEMALLILQRPVQGIALIERIGQLPR